MLRPADDDKNGKLDQRELARAAPRLGVLSQVAAVRLGVDVSAELKKLSAADRAALEQVDAYGRPGDMMADPAKAEQLFGRLDANGDQKLTLEEAPPMFADRFAEMIERGDRDGDKQLTKKEFLDLSRGLAEIQSAKVDPEAVRRFKRQLLRRFDRNNDGRLTVREAPPRLAQNFDRADANSNGFLDDAELTQAAQTMARLEASAPRGPFRGPATKSKKPITK
jgi:Ca2+-binding EF-hand superfamily protein